MMPRKIPILIVAYAALLAGSCSSRVVYEPSNAVAASAPAININTAAVEDLEILPHIGRKTAESIVQFRIENGPFRRVEQLMQIRGVSEKRFVEIRQFLTSE